MVVTDAWRLAAYHKLFQQRKVNVDGGANELTPIKDFVDRLALELMEKAKTLKAPPLVQGTATLSVNNTFSEMSVVQSIGSQLSENDHYQDANRDFYSQTLLRLVNYKGRQRHKARRCAWCMKENTAVGKHQFTREYTRD
jgi:hypothetical protein